MSAISRFVIWVCRKFNRDQIEKIVEELSSILKNPDSSIQPREDVDENYPNYRDFRPDTDAPLTDAEVQGKKKRSMSKRTSV